MFDTEEFVAAVACCICGGGEITNPEPECQSGLYIDQSDTKRVYVAAVYWVITTLTTVGYGDYKGYTP